MARAWSKRTLSTQLRHTDLQSHNPRSTRRPTAAVDVPQAVRGASSGFSVLLIGGLIAPLASIPSPLLGSVWVTTTAIVAFVVAGRKIGAATSPELQGAVASVLAYMLVLPLLLPFEAGRNAQQILLTFSTAACVGAVSGWIQSHLVRGRS